MAHFFQFVDSISASPTVLLDLDNDLPFGVRADSSVSPPTLRRTTTQGIRSDGELEVATAYDARTINLSLNVAEVSAESQATSIQKLARILDRREGAWLKWQSEGMNKPLFYRTRRASFDTIDTILDATPYRELAFSLSADPAGYGLPVTGSTATVTNDPTTGTNKMVMAFPTILGDLPTPLLLSFPSVDGEHDTTVASYSDYANGAFTAPYYVPISTPVVNASPPAGWTITDAADATMVSGNRRRLTKTSGTAMIRPTSAVVMSWSLVPVGDYRVMVRVAAAPAGAEILFFNKPPSTGSELIYSEAAGKCVVTAANAGKDWLDLGVVAMPGGAPITDVAFGLPGATGPALFNVAVNLTTTTGTVDLDAVMLIPAGRPNTVSRIGSVAFSSMYGTRTVTWDGVNDYRIANGISTFTAALTTVQAPSNLSGGNPLVCPGATNYLHFLATVANPSSATRVSDSKATTTVVSWSYYPRYLYNRPDTT